jgi:predicted Zn-ribbon and HTH transcriptional regulator
MIIELEERQVQASEGVFRLILRRTRHEKKMQSTKIICKNCYKFLGNNIQNTIYLIVCPRCKHENIKDNYEVEE